MRYRLAIFDFDGTLADSFPWFMENVNTMADRYGFRRIDRAEAEMLRGHDARQVMKAVGLPLWKAPLVARYMRRRMAEAGDDIPLFAGVESMLQGLSDKGVRLAIVSSNSEQNIRRVLGRQTAGLFHHYRCSSSLFGKRPKLRAVLRSDGIEPSQAICIGDEIRDITAAHAENIPFGAVSWGYTKVESLAAHSPREIFTEVGQILERVA